MSQVYPIKNRLRKYRRIASLSQKQVADILGMASAAQISRWERGERMPTLRHALQLSALYKRLVNDLFFDAFDEERGLIIDRQKVEVSDNQTTVQKNIFSS